MRTDVRNGHCDGGSRPWRNRVRSASEEEREMKVEVDFDKCESNAVCMGIAPEVFEVRDDGFLYVLQEEPPESLRGKCEDAADSCPTQAITIVG